MAEAGRKFGTSVPPIELLRMKTSIRLKRKLAPNYVLLFGITVTYRRPLPRGRGSVTCTGNRAATVRKRFRIRDRKCPGAPPHPVGSPVPIRHRAERPV